MLYYLANFNMHEKCLLKKNIIVSYLDLTPQISEGYLTYAMLKTANLCLKWSPSLKNGWKNLDDDWLPDEDFDQDVPEIYSPVGRQRCSAFP